MGKNEPLAAASLGQMVSTIHSCIYLFITKLQSDLLKASDILLNRSGKQILLCVLFQNGMILLYILHTSFCIYIYYRSFFHHPGLHFTSIFQQFSSSAIVMLKPRCYQSSISEVVCQSMSHSNQPVKEIHPQHEQRDIEKVVDVILFFSIWEQVSETELDYYET